MNYLYNETAIISSYMLCLCGCGQEVKLGNRFIVNHSVNVYRPKFPTGENNPTRNPRTAAIISQKAIDRWKDPEYRSRNVLSHVKTGAYNKERFSLMGKKSRRFENEIANEIKPEYDHMFLPYEVCDRIAIKDGKIYFIEIKHDEKHAKHKRQSKLTEKQEQFMKLVGASYRLIKR